MIYVGGVVVGKWINKEVTYKGLKSMVANELYLEYRDFNMKYKVILVGETLWDLIDDVGVDQLIEDNKTNDHVYVGEIPQLDIQQE